MRLSNDIAYDSAGTIEFLLDDNSGEFYFLEMNTRLQVEHPVTELVTGIDIVEWQLRCAGGASLPFSQSDIHCTGWAIEARIAAEDPANNYAPETGTIEQYSTPAFEGLRIDSGVHAGSKISPFYDSMLMKIIGYGPDRHTTINRLQRGLAGTELNGIGTNIGFLNDLLAAKPFTTGSHSTATIDALYPDGWAKLKTTPQTLAEAVLVRHLSFEQPQSNSVWESLGSWRVIEPSGRSGASVYFVDDASVWIAGRKGNHTITVDNEPPLDVSHAKMSGNTLSYGRGQEGD